MGLASIFLYHWIIHCICIIVWRFWTDLRLLHLNSHIWLLQWLKLYRFSHGNTEVPLIKIFGYGSRKLCLIFRSHFWEYIALFLFSVMRKWMVMIIKIITSLTQMCCISLFWGRTHRHLCSKLLLTTFCLRCVFVQIIHHLYLLFFLLSYLCLFFLSLFDIKLAHVVLKPLIICFLFSSVLWNESVNSVVWSTDSEVVFIVNVFFVVVLTFCKTGYSCLNEFLFI